MKSAITFLLFLSILVPFCLCGIVSRDCKDAIRAYHECTNKAHEAAQIRAMNLGDAKAKAEACFTKNGCKKPSPHVAHNHHRPSELASDAEFQKFEQCRRDLAEKFATLLQECVRKVVRDFDLPPLPFGNKSADATAAAADVPNSNSSVNSSEEAVDVFNEACDTTKKKEAVKKCVMEVGNATRPSRGQLKEVFDERCNANAECKKRLGKCDEVLKAVDKSICNCNNDISQTQYDAIWHGTSSCASLPVKPDLNGEHFTIDCANTPKDICDDGFEKFYSTIQNF